MSAPPAAAPAVPRRATLLRGHALAVLRTLPAASVHCCVTSPPYWGLRDYGLSPQVWGGDPACPHAWEDRADFRRGGRTTESRALGDHGRNTAAASPRHGTRSAFCGHCGAWSGSLGLEPTPDLYVDHLAAVFAEVRRVLRKDGTLWLNLGDCHYAGDRGGCRLDSRRAENSPLQARRAARGAAGIPRAPHRQPQKDLKNKDLVGLPWRVAHALQAAGWWLRLDCIWAKPNPMPESVRDRPTRAHEYVFLFSRSPRYFYDAAAVREPDLARDHPRRVVTHPEPSGGLLPRHRGLRTAAGRHGLGRNLRSVWTLPTHPYPDAHFATFPPQLAERCIRAGTSERGCCPACGAPWTRIASRSFRPQPDVAPAKALRGHAGQKPMDPTSRWAGTPRGTTAVTTTGWQPTCRCLEVRIAAAGIPFPVSPAAAAALLPQFDDLAPLPALVLDPFAGAGTTALVALRLNRHSLGIELKPDYVDLARRRIESDAPLLNLVTVEER